MEVWVWYVLGGLAAGVLSSMFGVGAGILLVPMLTLAFGFGQKSAQGMALAIIVPMALTGAIRYKLNPDIPLSARAVAVMAAGGIVGALIGSKLVFGIPNLVLKRLFACFIIFVGINIVVKSGPKPPPEEIPHAEHQVE
ncbi:MAG: sulfite exporter TauE/SafE family protein [Planctomycetota bacterium]